MHGHYPLIPRRECEESQLIVKPNWGLPVHGIKNSPKETGGDSPTKGSSSILRNQALENSSDKMGGYSDPKESDDFFPAVQNPSMSDIEDCERRQNGVKEVENGWSCTIS